MIGIVVVSHSRALAEAAVGLAAEMVDESMRPAISVAAGLDAETFGTDANAVAEAITSLDTDEGILVLLDLGSAVLSAEMALEFVEPEVAARVVLSSAPLVEGLVAAVVTASTGAPLDVVAAEARAGLAGKQDHLANDASAPSVLGADSERVLGDTPRSLGADAERVTGGERDPSPAAVPDESAELEVGNEHGLHARPAARLVTLVRQYDATVHVRNLRSDKGPVDARSLSRVATLDVRQGDVVQLAASGPQAKEVVAAISGLAASNWGDEAEIASAPNEAEAPGRRTGSGLDVAMGPATVSGLGVDLSGYVAGDVRTEQARSTAATATAVAQIDAVEKQSRQDAGVDAAAVFAAHRAMLEDPDLLDDVRREIDHGHSAVESWSRALDDVAASFEALPDAYQRERAQDVRSVQRRVLGALVGADPPSSTELSGILVVPELDAATAAAVDTDEVTGIVTVAGGGTGHGVIVARSRGIPILTDAGERAADIYTGAMVAFDAHINRLDVDPDPDVQAEFHQLIETRSAQRRTALAAATGPAKTTDGTHVVVEANVISVDDARSAAALGADGSGLLRTEVLFGGRPVLPTVAEQIEQFRAVCAALEGRPVTIRTWDVGGDKPLPYLPQPIEANPFLGERGLRLMRRVPDVLQDQLRAVAVVAAESPVRVMFPMVTTVDEVAWALDQVDEAVRDSSSGRPGGLQVGIMVEVPAAAIRIGELCRGLDFVSIGTNDLAQYTTAAERGNAAVATLADACDPAVLELIRRVCDDVPPTTSVAVCGDLASDPDAAVLLVGLGVRKLSVVGAQVPLVKARLRDVSVPAAVALADQALACRSAAEVRVLLRT